MRSQHKRRMSKRLNIPNKTMPCNDFLDLVMNVGFVSAQQFKDMPCASLHSDKPATHKSDFCEIGPGFA